MCAGDGLGVRDLAADERLTAAMWRVSLDSEALAAMASRPEWFYVAPDAEQQTAIYQAIAVTIPCPPGAFWGGR